jgi:transcriptional regulator with XRE-family HTH domain
VTVQLNQSWRMFNSLDRLALSVDAYEAWSKTVSRAFGAELRQARELQGWSRVQVVQYMPSGIGDRTLLSYEHGTRLISAVRLIEVCRVLGADPPSLVREALQRARVSLTNLNLRIDLRAVVKDPSEKYRPMRQWAINCLNDHPSGVIEVEPVAIRHLASFVGCQYLELANYLARFIPDSPEAPGEEEDTP